MNITFIIINVRLTLCRRVIDQTLSMICFVYDPFKITSIEETSLLSKIPKQFSIFFRYSEAFASEYLKILRNVCMYVRVSDY